MSSISTRPRPLLYPEHGVLVMDAPARRIAIMAKNWFQQFAGRFNFPNNYTCIDIETNGTSPERDLICSIGHTLVRDRQLVETKEVYLNWPDYPDGDADALEESLLRTERAMLSQGKPFHHTWDRLKTEGEPPLEVLQRYLDMFETMEERREVLVAHNGWKFDMEFFQSHFHNHLRIPFVFDEDLVYDSGICEKASQLEDEDDPFPQPGESMRQFAWRIGSLRRRGVFWALDRYCDERYGLFDKANADPSMAHAAGTDSAMLYYLVEEHRKLAAIEGA